MNREFDIASFDMVSWKKSWSRIDLSATEKYELLWKLFKYQVKLLELFRSNSVVSEREGFDSTQVQRLAKIQHRVINLAMEIGVPNLFPFVPVLPKQIVTTYNVIMKISHPGSNWQPHLNLDNVFDREKKIRPRFFPYFMFNINDGRLMEGLSPQENIVKIAVDKFVAVNLIEDLAYLLHSGQLDKSFFDHACGSGYGEEYSGGKNIVPGLCKEEQDNPALTRNHISKPISGWHCPSYQTYRRAVSLQGLISPKALMKLSTWQRMRNRFSYRNNKAD